MKGYLNCKIYNSDATAFLVKGNIIEKIGTDEQIQKELSELDECIDLNGMFVLPGFIDSHMHLLNLGQYLNNVMLSECSTTEEVLEKVKNHMESHDSAWIVGRGYHGDLNKQQLDAISTEKPIALTRVCGHVMTVNSKALELAGITEDTAVDGGQILFDSGRVEENAIYLIHEKMPEPDDDTLKEYIRIGAQYCNAHGITTIGSDDFLSIVKDPKRILNIFEQMSYQEKLTVRVNEQCEFENINQFAEFLDDGYTMDVGNDFFRIGPLKLITDGSLGARTAAMVNPYHDDPSTKGGMTMSDEDIEMFVKLANKFNMPTICHAIGDEAVDKVLAVFQDTVLEGNPLHHGLVHCQIMRQSQIDQVLKQKLSCYIQSQFIDYDASIYKERVGSVLAKTSYPFKTLFEGTLVSNGSDSPVELNDPLLGIQLACTRKSIHFGGEMSQKECLDLDQAIATFTQNGAKQLFMDDRLGYIKEGYIADFVVLEEDITEKDLSDVANTRVMMTVMDGKVVFER